jgi:hypothetical protein
MLTPCVCVACQVAAVPPAAVPDADLAELAKMVEAMKATSEGARVAAIIYLRDRFTPQLGNPFHAR